LIHQLTGKFAIQASSLLSLFDENGLLTDDEVLKIRFVRLNFFSPKRNFIFERKINLRRDFVFETGFFSFFSDTPYPCQPISHLEPLHPVHDVLSEIPQQAHIPSRDGREEEPREGDDRGLGLGEGRRVEGFDVWVDGSCQAEPRDAEKGEARKRYVFREYF
jgi:hypothetical protein